MELVDQSVESNGHRERRRMKYPPEDGCGVRDLCSDTFADLRMMAH